MSHVFLGSKEEEKHRVMLDCEADTLFISLNNKSKL